MIGQNILHYKILEKLGEGGMGVVYKAKDRKLERTVAIKFLPRHITANADIRKRFEIEAKAAAALNHPNIATIYAIEEADDEMFIVMEYIEGCELREIVMAYPEAPIAISAALNYATQIAEGLHAAHDVGAHTIFPYFARIILTAFRPKETATLRPRRWPRMKRVEVETHKNYQFSY
jgi:serine/threonine-protein kinase